jgi:hypothetical protein
MILILILKKNWQTYKLDTKQKSKKLKKNSVNERQRRHVNVNKLKNKHHIAIFRKN